jgi:hypothetical protein
LNYEQRIRDKEETERRRQRETEKRIRWKEEARAKEKLDREKALKAHHTKIRAIPPAKTPRKVGRYPQRDRSVSGVAQLVQGTKHAYDEDACKGNVNLSTSENGGDEEPHPKARKVDGMIFIAVAKRFGLFVL